MLPMRQKQHLYSSQIQTSDDIAAEAKRLLVTDSLEEEIQYDVQNIIQPWIGQINNDLWHKEVYDKIYEYFDQIKYDQVVYDFAIEISPEKEISIHYKQSPVDSVMVLTVKII